MTLRKGIFLAFLAGIAFVVVAAAAWKLFRPGYLPQMKEPQAKAAPTILDRGEYLARAGDCIACHSDPGGTEFAGGRAMATPFGNLYNIKVLMDANLLADERLVFNAGTHRDVVHLRQEDFRRLVRPEVVHLTREVTQGAGW